MGKFGLETTALVFLGREELDVGTVNAKVADAAEALVAGVSKISSYGGHYIHDDGVGQTTKQKKAPKKTGSL
jgi:hypothetical protein